MPETVAFKFIDAAQRINQDYCAPFLNITGVDSTFLAVWATTRQIVSCQSVSCTLPDIFIAS